MKKNILQITTIFLGTFIFLYNFCMAMENQPKPQSNINKGDKKGPMESIVGYFSKTYFQATNNYHFSDLEFPISKNRPYSVEQAIELFTRFTDLKKEGTQRIDPLLLKQVNERIFAYWQGFGQACNENNLNELKILFKLTPFLPNPKEMMEYSINNLIQETQSFNLNSK